MKLVLTALRNLVFFAALLAASLTVAAAQEAETLTIVTKGGARHTFAVEVARTDTERAQGLMYRQSLAPLKGMLFEFGKPQPVTMWMRNTYISLDMVFIRQDGTIGRIAERTEPLSERLIHSEGDVTAVFEIGGGEAKRLGISAGDAVDYPSFKKH